MRLIWNQPTKRPPRYARWEHTFRTGHVISVLCDDGASSSSRLSDRERHHHVDREEGDERNVHEHEWE